MSKLHIHLLHPRLGKISNNLESHGDENVPGFTIPVDGEMDAEQLDDLMGKGFSKRVFTESGAPAAGFALCAPLAHSWTWAKVHADLVGEEGGPNVLEFPDSRVKDLQLEFGEGRMTRVHFALYVRPGFGEDNLALQRWQREELGELVLTNGERQLKASEAQGKLALGGQGSGAAAGSQTGGGEAPSGSTNGDSVPAAATDQPTAH